MDKLPGGNNNMFCMCLYEMFCIIRKDAYAIYGRVQPNEISWARFKNIMNKSASYREL